jgi:cephalosporin-C deacetylase
MSIPKTHPFSFDPTYGMTLDDLRAIVPPDAPAGFDAFWQKRYKRALAIDPKPALSESKLTHPQWQVLDITYVSTGGIEIGGWLLLPRDGPVRRGLVVGHGYGGRDASDFDLPVEETAILFPCFRGMSKSAHPPIPPDAPAMCFTTSTSPTTTSSAAASRICGLPSRRCWRSIPGLPAPSAISAWQLRRRHRRAGDPLRSPHRSRSPDRAHLRRPQKLADAADRRQRRFRPDLREDPSRTRAREPRLFDAAIAATRITVPMLVAPALFDPAVAPPCQFAVANALPASKYNEIFILDAGHFDYPGMTEQNFALRQKVRGFFKVHEPGISALV